ncbi:MAG: acyl-CoA dehydrogenase, partial [Hyphomicrobiales bacterium]|nr:acyl-CoA dehydrogenase [Hyphomicrobiales bacterium]
MSAHGRPHTPDDLDAVVRAAERLFEQAKVAVRARVAASSIDAEQAAAHGLAWLATTIEAMRQLSGWARRLSGDGRLGELEALIAVAGIAEYAQQVAGGIPMSQAETVRIAALGVPRSAIRAFEDAASGLIEAGTSQATQSKIAAQIALQPGATTFGDTGLDETLSQMREQMKRFGDTEVKPHAHQWHLENA